jgi:hypothetical protein
MRNGGRIGCKRNDGGPLVREILRGKLRDQAGRLGAVQLVVIESHFDQTADEAPIDFAGMNAAKGKSRVLARTGGGGPARDRQLIQIQRLAAASPGRHHHVIFAIHDGGICFLIRQKETAVGIARAPTQFAEVAHHETPIIHYSTLFGIHDATLAIPLRGFVDAGLIHLEHDRERKRRQACRRTVGERQFAAIELHGGVAGNGGIFEQRRLRFHAGRADAIAGAVPTAHGVAVVEGIEIMRAPDIHECGRGRKETRPNDAERDDEASPNWKGANNSSPRPARARNEIQMCHGLYQCPVPDELRSTGIKWPQAVTSRYSQRGILSKTPVDRIRCPFTVGAHNLLSMKPSLSLFPLTAALLLANEFVVSSFASSPPPIPMNQLGAVAGKQYQGDGLSVRGTATGAELRCAFQRLEGEVTAEGLWLRSTAVEAEGERFRLLATGVGRDRECAAGSCCGSADWQSAVSRIGNPQAAPGWSVQPTASRRHSRLPTCATLTPLEDFGFGSITHLSLSDAESNGVRKLPGSGRVRLADQVAQLLRPGVTEEYSVSVDGVRQDFLIAQPPAGTGELRLELDVTGAAVAPLGDGVRLTLSGSGRQLAYHRLHVTDATGRELPARMEVAAGILPDVEGAHPAARNSRATVLTGYLEATTESAGLEAPALRQAEMPAATRLAVLVDDANAVYPVRIDPTFSDANWVSMGELPGADGPVYAIATDGSGNLYCGGHFSAIGNTRSAYIAKWDGNNWTQLGLGLNGRVNALVVSGGDVYAGGAFTTAGGVTANLIAKWDGNTWSALGTGIENWGVSVEALAVSGSNVYVGGSFTSKCHKKHRQVGWRQLGELGGWIE